MASMADVLIIGAGPAGLSSALGLCRQMYKTIVFDSGVYRNARSQHMHTVPTWDHMDAKTYRAAARKEILTRYTTTTFVDHKVLTIKRADTGLFEVTTDDGRAWSGKKVVLATGVKDVFPDIKGFDECWGSSIFHCLFCHGYEERGGEHAGVLAVDFMVQKQFVIPVACMAKNLAKSVTLYTNGNKEVAHDLRDHAANQNLGIDDRKIASVTKVSNDGSALDVTFVEGTVERLSFLQHAPRTVPTGPWAEQLGLEVNLTGDYKTIAPFQETNMHGVFACGDAGSPVKSVPSALNAGLLCTAGAVHQLATGQ